ncbi:hypothetical protein E1B28_001023 [Marasmius oreades]|uniref:RRP15-like protein n=1 Tax=Marasmius oreades TaxID=181124 RepID=A0A9P7V2Q1_9AGAR|nr:uncharacterized protein E1B28_001023 [Marasmius oreades]KAG7099152.1 hypothetical protein E1B28_001023 [Marasmius oreades]
MSSQKRPPSEDLDDISASENEDHYASGFGTDEPADSGNEILSMKPQKSRQTKKRKIRATGASSFGATLQSLLATSVPTQSSDSNAPIAPLALKPSVGRKLNNEKLEMRAKRIVQLEKKEKEDKGRVKDVIGGWGVEGERGLRKVAQRGVVKLFNYIQESQNQTSAAVEELKAARGSGKPTLAAPSITEKWNGKKKKKDQDNILGRGKESAVGKEDFFDMIRTGTVVPKA